MITNVGIQTPGLIIWDGTASTPRDIRRYVQFGFVFEVTAELASDVVFNAQYHDPTDADPCLPGPAQPVEDIPLCDSPIEPGTQASFTIPAGTPVGSVCAATLHCRPGAFLSLASASADAADVNVVLILKGPTGGA